MPDTLTELAAHADELADRCERTVPHTSGHADAVAALQSARDGPPRAAAVDAARAEGMSWSAIALVLGLSTTACRARYPPADPLDARVPQP